MPQNHGQVWWTELRTRDVAGALTYYKDVCGWNFEALEMQGILYHVGRRGDRPVVGVADMRALPELDGAPPHWFSYFAVNSLERALEKSAARGGQVIRPPVPIDGLGRIAIVSDPSGAALGLITPE
ncbi:MAG: VOC family protein [Rhodobacteraceae bacterium]|nr:VOC family protein [Paracoccaceae bacterium]